MCFGRKARLIILLICVVLCTLMFHTVSSFLPHVNKVLVLLYMINVKTTYIVRPSSRRLLVSFNIILMRLYWYCNHKHTMPSNYILRNFHRNQSFSQKHEKVLECVQSYVDNLAHATIIGLLREHFKGRIIGLWFSTLPDQGKLFIQIFYSF